MKFKHMHPITIWDYLSRISFLLIIPTIQTIFSSPQDKTFATNVAILLFLASWGIFQYFANRFCINEQKLLYREGLLRQRKREYPTQNFLSAVVRMTPPLSLFGAAQLFLDTPAGCRKNADVRMILTKKRLIRMWNTMTAYSKTIYRASNGRILLMAASWSNPAAGLLLAGLFLNRTGKIVGQELSERLYETVNQSYRLAAFGIPPLIALVGYLLAAGWAAAFLVQFIRYANFTIGTVPITNDSPVMINKANDAFTIKRGLIIQNRQLLSRTAICAVSIQQTLIMRILKLSSAYLHTFGAGKEKGDKSLLFAAVDEKSMRESIAELFPRDIPRFMETKGETRPDKTALNSFLFTPIVSLIGVFLLGGALYWFYPEFAPLTFFAVPPILWQLVIRFFSWKSTKLCVNSSMVIASSYRRLTLYTTYIPREQLQRVTISQNFIQRIFGRCTLHLCTGAEKTGCFTVNHLDKQQVLKLLNR